MALLTTHTLNAVDGTHAGPVDVALFQVDEAGSRKRIFSDATDEGGRLSRTIQDSDIVPACSYELVFQTGAYFKTKKFTATKTQIIEEVVIRFTMPDAGGKYHIPVILSPNGYSVWWSGE